MRWPITGNAVRSAECVGTRREVAHTDLCGWTLAIGEARQRASGQQRASVDGLLVAEAKASIVRACELLE